MQLDDARGAAMPDRDLLVAFGLPHLKREVDERNQYRKPANEAAQRREHGK
jgi:hypothetical protein